MTTEEPKNFRFFSATRYGYFAAAASQTEAPVSLPFASLSQRLKTKFRNAGVRASEQARTAEDAELLYLQIPRPARLSEDHVGKFLQAKDASHIKNHGGNQIARKEGFNPLNAAENLVWEDSRINRRRGGRDMTDAELTLAKNSISGEGAIFFVSNALRAGLRNAYIGASLEIPLAALEDFVARQGRVSLTFVGKSAGISGLIGGVSGIVLHGLLELVPESTLNSEWFKISMLTAGSLGVASYLWELSLRLKAAAEVKRPENTLVTFVICPCCVFHLLTTHNLSNTLFES